MWAVENPRTWSTSRGRLCSWAWDGHVLGAVVGEDALDVRQETYEQDIDQEDGKPEQSLHQIAGFVGGYHVVQGAYGKEGRYEEQANS